MAGQGVGLFRVVLDPPPTCFSRQIDGGIKLQAAKRGLTGSAESACCLLCIRKRGRAGLDGRINE